MQDETSATPQNCPPVVCPDWCTSTTGHAEEDLVEDPRHTGSSHHVTLSREDQVSYGRTSEMEYVSVQSETEDGPDSALCVSLASRTASVLTRCLATAARKMARRRAA